MISIVNYGLGNLGSIRNMFKRIGVDVEIISRPEDLEKASKIILPGVGAFDSGMNHLNNNNWIEALQQKAVEEKIPVLGICLGMQLMTKSSEEGSLPGLGWVDAKVKKFAFDGERSLRVPHMGWNNVTPRKKSNLLKESIKTDSRFYFVHSFFVSIEDKENELLTCSYGHEFTAAFELDNIMGVQFHPEKSHRFGMELFKNFAEL